MSPPGPNNLYRNLHRSPAQAAADNAFTATLREASAGAFAEFRALGYQELTYHAKGGQQVWRPIFTNNQVNHVPMASDTVGGSDQIPFTLAGVPDAMFSGNFSYYDTGAPAASYPFDQAQDTVGLMNTFADGGAGQSQALTMALGLPGMLTAWMLSQPGVLGQARADGHPIAAIGSIGPVMPQRPVTLTASAYVPDGLAARLKYSWRFGDGTVATGQTVRHAYTAVGSRTLRLTVTAPGHGARTVSQVISVGRPATYTNALTAPGTKAIFTGRPPANPEVHLPVARPGLTDKVGRAPAVRRPTPAKSSPTWWVVAAIVLVVLAAIIAIAGRRRLRRQGAGG